MKQFNRTLALLLGNELLNLRVAFSIEKEMTSSGSSNSEIRIFNLSKKHLTQIEVGTRNQNLTLSVGYGGQNKLLYSGPIFYANSERNGGDVVTKCQMLPGVAARTAAYVNISGAADDNQVLNAVLGALAPYGIVRGRISQGVVTKLQSGTYARTLSEIGSTARMMDMITRRHGLKWNTDHNALNVYDKGEYEDQELVFLSKDTGLIGIPSKMQDGNYAVKALLNADLVPGKRIRVESEVFPINGDLKVQRGKYEGDSYEGDWHAELECLSIGTEPDFVLGAQ